MDCCVVGCKNRHSPTSKLTFHRIPRGYRSFQVKRRRLWLKAIQQVNGSTDNLKGNALICGAHFISGKASTDHDDPDFVPSIFPCSKQNPSPKKKQRWVFGRRKKRHKANVKVERATPSEDDSPMEHQSTVFMDETQTSQSPSVPKEGGTLITGSETEPQSNTVKSQISSSPKKPSPSFKVPADLLKQGKRIPTVRLKSVFAPASGFKCDLCNEVFAIASQLVIHKQLHEEEERPTICEICGNRFTSQADFTQHQHAEEPSFPCNMCDRSFTTSQNLKRHKLLHVKDGRKCHKCGVIFCRLHNHILFKPQPETDQDSSITESLVEPEPNHPTDSNDNAQSTVTTSPLQTTTVQTALPAPPTLEPVSRTLNPLPPVSHTRIISEIPIPVLMKSPSMPRSPLPIPKYSRDDFPAAVAQPHLPPTLKIFSPQYLTSAFLEVNRNYKYIFSKPIEDKIERNIVKEEPCERPLIPPCEQNIGFKKDRIAYDLEIVL